MYAFVVYLPGMGTNKLVVDIGNTALKAALFDGSQITDKLYTGSLNTDRLCRWVEQLHIGAAIVGRSGGTETMVERLRSALKCPLIKVDGQTRVPLKNDYQVPQTLGVDRMAAAVGAWTNSKGEGKWLMVVDVGTCMTFEYVSPEGIYLGGAIAPGLRMRLKAMAEGTATLPMVDAGGSTDDVERNTEDAIRSGVVVGMADEIASRIDRAKNRYGDVLVFLTGGDCFFFADIIKKSTFADIITDPHLVLRGLNCILDYQNEHF